MPLTQAEKSKRYRERLKIKNPEKYEEFRKKANERAMQAYRAKVATMTAEQNKKQRAIWREQNRLYKRKRSAHTEHSSKLQDAKTQLKDGLSDESGNNSDLNRKSDAETNYENDMLILLKQETIETDPLHTTCSSGNRNTSSVSLMTEEMSAETTYENGIGTSKDRHRKSDAETNSVHDILILKEESIAETIQMNPVHTLCTKDIAVKCNCKPREDEYDIYAKYVAAQLRLVGPERAVKLQLQMHNLLSEACLDALRSKINME